jgi:lipopolysaccharide transport system ATP-binding protein
MSDLAVQVQGLGKQYRLGGSGPSRTLRESLVDAFTLPARLFRSRKTPRRANDYIWALRDTSFDVHNGEVIGLVGRNGAGKSTLLKLLSRITEPTEGEAIINGRVGSLLEVGTGFHPELTGRENIFLNGALLGMRKVEIDAKFDQIVEFSEVEKFLDTPVKRYSSGMYTRLAFAVAAHLEPEILIVDEVLAVGDAAFQKKCLGKMSQVAREGRTVLFVSHNMAAVQSLCTRAILLEQGRIAATGDVPHVVNAYLQSAMAIATTPLDQRPDRIGDQSTRLTSIRVENADRDGGIHTGCRLRITIEYQAPVPVQRPMFYAHLHDLNNVGIHMFDNESVGGLPDALPARGTVTCVTQPITLTAGRCYFNVAMARGGILADGVEHATSFDIEAADVYGTGKMWPRDKVLCTLGHAWSAG